MFRSEEMVLCQLFVQQEAAFASVSMIGESGLAEFRDMNATASPFTRKFVGEVRRCEELERKLRYVAEEMKKDGIVIPRASNPDPRALYPGGIIELEANLEKTEGEIMELGRNAVNLKASFVELTEMKQVLEQAQVFLAELEEIPGKAFVGEERGTLGVLAGVIPRERAAAFETMLWRISRGNVLVRQADLGLSVKDPMTNAEVQKAVFVAFFHGENLKTAVKKVCSGFRATTYFCPGTALERSEVVRQLRTRLQDLILILDQTYLHRRRVLAAVRKEFRDWSVLVLKTKSIYHTLNMFNMDVTNKCLIGECWVPVKDLPTLRQVLLQSANAAGSNIPSFLNIIPAESKPPTYVPTNKFTAGFQALTDAYSVASYREVNPAVYSIVTFPFLFAVMFGDLGHGLIMTVFALVMVMKEEKLVSMVRGSEIMSIFFGGRYVILLMGLFSIYTGLMYNDLFSVSVRLGNSGWTPSSSLTLDPEKDFNGPYAFGLDPIWQLAENKIIFLNSFKMKLSIIIGVVHMVFGVCLGVVNHITKRRPILILLQTLPQLIFLLFLFGYLAALIVFKWWKYGSIQDGAVSASCAPSVLITFINMMLRNEPPSLGGCSPWMYAGQARTERVLVYTALACVPFMLLAKPIHILYTRPKADMLRRNSPLARRSSRVGIIGLDDDDEDVIKDGVLEDETVPGSSRTTPSAEPLVLTAASAPEDDKGGQVGLGVQDHDEHEPFGELMVHQCIHTVEFVLSTVSHTASYLRLWALSLAHSQLSHVLWSMVLRKGLVLPYWLVLPLPLIFAAWAFFTISILVLMEGLSAFLHTLRLHWVEFMSKFYEGEGYPFRPFSFKAIMTSAEATEIK